MPPRSQPLPQAKTESAREARRAFFCELCQKGYARTTDYQSHLASYDHTHRQRMKDMKVLTRDPKAASRPRKEESSELSGRIDLPLKSSVGGAKNNLSDASSLASAGSALPKKKPVFKALTTIEVAAPVMSGKPDAAVTSEEAAVNEDDPSAARANGWDADAYDPTDVEGNSEVREVIFTPSGALALA